MNVSDLNNLIRAAMDEHELADPAALSVHVLAGIEDDDLRGALMLCLPGQIKRVIHGRRSVALSAYRQEATLRELQGVGGLTDRLVPSLVGLLNKLHVEGLLDQRVYAGDHWKFLGDCTAADLRNIAQAHRDLAAQNVEQAKLYEELAVELEDSGQGTLRGLVACARSAA